MPGEQLGGGVTQEQMHHLPMSVRGCLIQEDDGSRATVHQKDATVDTLYLPSTSYSREVWWYSSASIRNGRNAIDQVQQAL